MRSEVVKGVFRWAGRWAIGGVCLVVGCESGPPPQRIELELPEFVLSGVPVKAQVWAWDEKNQRSEAQKPEYEVAPEDLASVKAGMLTCQRTGDGQVTATVRSVTAMSGLKCRLVDHLEAPEDLGRVDINGGVVRLNVGAFTKDGKKLEDVPVSITTKNSRVARAKGAELLPLAVGEAKMEVRAGDATAEFPVEIVRLLEPELLPIDQDRRIHFSLEPGKYELVVELEAEKKLNVEWRGAPYCNGSGTAKRHVSVCVLRTKGGVVFDNPAFLESGSTEISRRGITLHEVP